MSKFMPGRIGLVAIVCCLSATAQAAIESNISETKHNFSATVNPGADVTRDVEASTESQICVYCHTPHGATDEPKAPLWNRQLSGATYIPYSSTSLEATDLDQPGGKSKLCLSCHDGTLAISSVNVLNRVENPTIAMTGLDAGDTMPGGTYGEDTGFTRRLGTDLRNDHPISFTFDSAQAVRDGELFDPAVATHIDERVTGSQPALPQGHFLPLEDNKVECISCHDPHVKSDLPGENNKFLRVNRFQQQPPVDGAFNEESDIICLGCHDKDGWVGSAHANPAVAEERYQASAAELREFPDNHTVWEAACLNCHDPHTVQGSRRILREGTDGPVAIAANGARYKQGGNPAVEEVCWACHSADGAVLQGQISPSTNSLFEVPDIKTDFTTMARHMPIQTIDQPAGMEVHSIGTTDGLQGSGQFGQDFIEAPQNLGKGNLTNRHAECTDCHNPHRVMKNRLFNADNTVPDAAGTHRHEDGVPHTNLASGVLRGIWGVEPIYASTEFGQNPVAFDVKRGDPGVGGSTDVSAPYLTREYQLCLKCHSNYAYDTPPSLGYYSGSTPPGSAPALNSYTLQNYTNQAMEYQSPDDHKGEGTSGTPSGAFAGLDGGGNVVDYQTDNHRSWHPAVKETGRTPLVRKANADVWRSPFNAAVGTQTMYCSDCHGSTTAPDTVVPDGGENGYPWGPHGSNDNFLLKGPWNNLTGRDQPNGLCFRCHDYNQYGRAIPPPYSGASPPVLDSGFKSNGTWPMMPYFSKNLHVGHSSLLRYQFNAPFLCTFCHIEIPHGWKNKVFLANLNDVGPEAGKAAGTQVRCTAGNGPDCTGTGRYYQGPYYNGAALKVTNFARSGEWAPSDCGSAGPPGNGLTGQAWMATGNEACLLLP